MIYWKSPSSTKPPISSLRPARRPPCASTGSGKTTTLAAILEEINRNQNANIFTIEDPIEYVFTDKKSVIHQREVGQDTQSFESALRSVMRQSPDVIAVGELRDKETMDVA